MFFIATILSHKIQDTENVDILLGKSFIDIKTLILLLLQ